MEKLSLEINTENKVQQISLSGELTGLSALEFRQKIASVLEDQFEQLIIDIQDVHAIDLTGFNALVMLKSISEKRRKTFSMLISNESPISEYIHLSKLNLNQRVASS